MTLNRDIHKRMQCGVYCDFQGRLKRIHKSDYAVHAVDFHAVDFHAAV